MSTSNRDRVPLVSENIVSAGNKISGWEKNTDRKVHHTIVFFGRVRNFTKITDK